MDWFRVLSSNSQQTEFLPTLCHQKAKEALLNSQMTCLRELDLSENGISEAEAGHSSEPL